MNAIEWYRQLLNWGLGSREGKGVRAPLVQQGCSNGCVQGGRLRVPRKIYNPHNERY